MKQPEIIVTKEPLKKPVMVDIKPQWVASFFSEEDIINKYGSVESFIFQDTLGYKRNIEPKEQIFAYSKQDLY